MASEAEIHNPLRNVPPRYLISKENLREIQAIPISSITREESLEIGLQLSALRDILLEYAESVGLDWERLSESEESADIHVHELRESGDEAARERLDEFLNNFTEYYRLLVSLVLGNMGLIYWWSNRFQKKYNASNDQIHTIHQTSYLQVMRLAYDYEPIDPEDIEKIRDFSSYIKLFVIHRMRQIMAKDSVFGLSPAEVSLWDKYRSMEEVFFHEGTLPSFYQVVNRILENEKEKGTELSNKEKRTKIREYERVKNKIEGVSLDNSEKPFDPYFADHKIDTVEVRTEQDLDHVFRQRFLMDVLVHLTNQHSGKTKDIVVDLLDPQNYVSNEKSFLIRIAEKYKVSSDYIRQVRNELRRKLRHYEFRTSKEELLAWFEELKKIDERPNF